MAPTIFLLGATGYVGGNTLHHIKEKHPDYKITALVRDDAQAAAIKKRFPDVTTVLGDLNSGDVISRESSKADIVLNAASSDHVGGVMSIFDGLSRGEERTSRALIHVSGTGILWDSDLPFGAYDDKVYSDVDGLAEMISLPLTRLHRDADNAVLTGSSDARIRTAIVCPPLIHGVGNGPVKTRSIQLPWLAEQTLKRGKGFQVGQAKNRWNHIHVDDVSMVLINLVEEALKPDGGKATWGQEGYYFVESGEFEYGALCAAVAKEAHSLGAIPSDEVEPLSTEEILKLTPYGPVLWGSNSRCRAQRLGQVLGWRPLHDDAYFWETIIPQTVKLEINPKAESEASGQAAKLQS